MNKLQVIGLCCDFLDSTLGKEEWFVSVRPSVAAIILYGPASSGAIDTGSIVNIMVLLPKNLAQKYSKGKYSYDYKDYQFRVVTNSVEKLREIASGGFSAKESKLFADCVILAQSDNEVGDLIRKLSKE